MIGALVNGLLLVGAVGYVLLDAYRRFQDPRPVDPLVVVGVGVVGLGANLAAAWVLTDHRDALNVEGAFLHLMADSLNVLLQGTPRDVDIAKLGAALEAVDGVTDVHHVHAGALDSRWTALSAHLVVEEGIDRDEILGRCRRELADRFGIDHATIQLEPEAFVETVEMDCYPASGD